MTLKTLKEKFRAPAIIGTLAAGTGFVGIGICSAASAAFNAAANGVHLANVAGMVIGGAAGVPVGLLSGFLTANLIFKNAGSDRIFVGAVCGAILGAIGGSATADFFFEDHETLHPKAPEAIVQYEPNHRL